MENKYTEYDKDQLLLELKKLKSNKTISSFMIGVCLGIIIFGLIKNGFGLLYIGICTFLIFISNKSIIDCKKNIALVEAAIKANESKEQQAS